MLSKDFHHTALYFKRLIRRLFLDAYFFEALQTIARQATDEICDKMDHPQRVR